MYVWLPETAFKELSSEFGGDLAVGVGANAGDILRKYVCECVAKESSYILFYVSGSS